MEKCICIEGFFKSEESKKNIFEKGVVYEYMMIDDRYKVFSGRKHIGLSNKDFNAFFINIEENRDKIINDVLK